MSTYSEHGRAVELICTLSLAGDIGIGLHPEHCLRTSYIATRAAQQIGLTPEQQQDVYHAALLKDAGCTSWNSQMALILGGDEMVARREALYFSDLASERDMMGWTFKYVGAGSSFPQRAMRLADFFAHGRDFIREGFMNAGEVAARMASRLGASAETQTALRLLFERWDGKGMPLGLRGEGIPLVARIVNPATHFEVAHTYHGPGAARQMLKEKSGKAFDPQVVEALLMVSAQPEFSADLGQESFWHTVIAIEPAASAAFIDAGMVDSLAHSFADFVDLKSVYTAGHSRQVADLSGKIAKRLRLSDGEFVTLHRALMHDVGLIAMPAHSLNRPRNELTPEEAESLRQHPQIAVDILTYMPLWENISQIIACHHQLSHDNPDQPLGAKIISIADLFVELTHDGPGRAASTTEEAIETIQKIPNLDRDILAAFFDEIAITSQQRGRRLAHQQWPAGLSDREVEVLHLVAKGMSRKQMARALFLSESTVRHHLEHIYDKIGVSTRVAAALFAMENGLFDS